MRDMTNAETAAHLREYVKSAHDIFSWPTDACGYDQHIRFVRHRNANWRGDSTNAAWIAFVLAYAETLEAAK